MSTLGRFAPPIALMGLIYYLSAQQDLNSHLGWIDFVGRKGVHMTEFGGLFLLWLRAFGWRRPAIAATIAILYAVGDEVHQHFVPGRHGLPVDVLIDSAGVLVAYLLYRMRAGRRPRPTASHAR